ncbi:MAG: metallophosphoesterase [Ruminococcus sp.]|nr:metallophosphoesterase [Ruminococcus sp.]
MKYLIPLVIVFLIYVIIENFFILTVRREIFVKNGLRIAHIADIHKKRYGKGNKRLCGKVRSENPDIILISGDLVSRDCTDFSRAETTLRSLAEICPVYLVYGNHEQDLSEEYKNKLKEAVKRSGAVLLENKTVRLDINGNKVSLSGLVLKYSVYKKDGHYRNLDVTDKAEITESIGEASDGKNILLVHNPLFAEDYAQWGADYAVCGHVHGGSVVIPFTRIGVLSPERKFFPKYSKGVYTVGKMKLLLSGGLGKPRLFNFPELVIYEI